MSTQINSVPGPIASGVSTTAADPLSLAMVESQVLQPMRHLLASSVVLFLNYRRYSLAADRSHLAEPHEVFRLFAESMKSSFDELINHLTGKGLDPNSTLDAIAILSYVKHASPEGDYAHLLHEAKANARIVVERVRAACQVATTAGDLDSEMLLGRFLLLHEKQQLYLEEQANLFQQFRA